MQPVKTDAEIFCRLYKEAYLRCFKKELVQPATETESKLFYQQILGQTGLAIGWRSLKNYSFYLLDQNAGKAENPSIATLDTLSRYVLNAPYTNEIKRKAEEEHHPYWFRYREQALSYTPLKRPKIKKYRAIVIAAVGVTLIALLLLMREKPFINVNDDFGSNSTAALRAKGWQIKEFNKVYWRQEKTGLTLFTLEGDNWPDSNATPRIQNLLVRKLPKGCFTTELHLENFIPSARWQQAGILLMQDTDINSQSMRVSLAYNDFFGGYKNPREALVQGISVPGKGRKPEEFAHYKVLALDSAKNNPALLQNLSHSALRIEKEGDTYRILYAGGQMSNMAFKLITAQKLNFVPQYIGIFALKGFEPETKVMPVHISRFLLEQRDCNK